MTTGILTLFTTYLIFPIVALIMVGVAALVAKKNGLLKNKRLVVYTLLSVLILAVPALAGFLGYHFMPYGYIALAGVYVIVGAYNDRLLPWAFNKDDLKYRARLIYSLFQLAIAMTLFVLVFNLCNDLKYGLWASTAMLTFLLPPLSNYSGQGSFAKCVMFGETSNNRAFCEECAKTLRKTDLSKGIVW